MVDLVPHPIVDVLSQSDEYRGSSAGWGPLRGRTVPYPVLAGLVPPVVADLLRLGDEPHLLICRHRGERDIRDVEHAVVLRTSASEYAILDVPAFSTRANLGLRQAVIDDAHESAGAHRVAHLRDELGTAFRRMDLREVDDGHGRIFDYSAAAVSAQFLHDGRYYRIFSYFLPLS